MGWVNMLIHPSHRPNNPKESKNLLDYKVIHKMHLIKSITFCEHDALTLNLPTYSLAGKSSSSYRAGSTDIPDPLSPLLPIVHRPR